MISRRRSDCRRCSNGMTYMLMRTIAKPICSLALAVLMVGSGLLERTHLAHCHGDHGSGVEHVACHSHHPAAHSDHDSHHAHEQDASEHALHRHACDRTDVASSHPNAQADKPLGPTCRAAHDPAECAICRHLRLTPLTIHETSVAVSQLVVARTDFSSPVAPTPRVWEQMPIRGPPSI